MRISDWSSDVCSSDLAHSHEPIDTSVSLNGSYVRETFRSAGFLVSRSCRPAHSCHPSSASDVWQRPLNNQELHHVQDHPQSPGRRLQDRTSVGQGKSWSVREDRGGRLVIKKKK